MRLPPLSTLLTLKYHDDTPRVSDPEQVPFLWVPMSELTRQVTCLDSHLGFCQDCCLVSTSQPVSSCPGTVMAHACPHHWGKSPGWAQAIRKSWVSDLERAAHTTRQLSHLLPPPSAPAFHTGAGSPWSLLRRMEMLPKCQC